MEIKNRYIFIAIIVLLLLTFSAGWFGNNLYSKGRVTEYSSRISELEGKLDTQGSNLAAVTTELNSTTIALEEAEATIDAITNTNTELTTSNRKDTEIIRNLRAGTSEDIDGLSDIVGRLDGYLK